MNSTLRNNWISSYKTSLVLLVLYAFLLATATLVEKYYGTPAALTIIYYSPLFIFLQFVMVLNFVAIVLRKKLLRKRKWGFILLHFAFIVILAGALVSHLFGREGTFHLREGEKGNQLEIQNGKKTAYKTLPFSLELIEFTVQRYPGSSSPSSFESRLIVHEDDKSYEKTISMNNVLDIKGYRFFQASFDKDENGTILSVNKDLAGRNITYTGYFVLLLGFIACFTGKNSRFRQLSRQLKAIKIPVQTTIIILFLSFPLLPLHAETAFSPLDTIQKNKINPEHAAAFGALPMLSNSGRIEPVNTFASEILRKLHKSEKIAGLNPDQFLLSLYAFPEIWIHLPFIKVSKEVALYYNLTEGECAYIEAFDRNGNYKFNQQLSDVFNKAPSERNRFDKELLKFDEKMNIFRQLLDFQLLNIFPKENDRVPFWYAPGDNLSYFSGQDSLFVSGIMDWYVDELREASKTGNWSKAGEVLEMIKTYQQKRNHTVEVYPQKIKAELLYNQLNIFRHCKKGYLILGGLLLVFSFFSLLKVQKWTHLPIRLLIAGIFLCFLCHLFGIGLRGYISGYAPWSNSYETMVYVSWVTVLAGLFFVRKSPVTYALAALFGGIILFVSGLNWMDPQINPLVPVLKSPWLMFHVAIIVAAYGFAGISCLVGLTNLSLMSLPKKKPALAVRIRELTIINEMAMLIGLALMTTGTFLGAIWANESWGRYWGWDPKETWALITIVTYAVTLHLRLVKRGDNTLLFNLMAVLSFLSVLMTYFGVNYFLSGMHSYG
jgi:cytochrome c-type biogenesis protein CcsB